jgi:RNA polymerase sigma factor (sigma-70 family)
MSLTTRSADGPNDYFSDLLVRELAPRVLGAIARKFADFAAAEDAVQEALLAAHLEWRKVGIPANPGGWLYRVASRRMADHLDDEAARRRREAIAGGEAAAGSAPAADTHVDAPAPNANDPDANDPMVHDDTLVLLFMCCHLALTPPSAIALTLRAVGGLTTAEIARAFLVPEATMAQRISRAKQTIAQSGVPFAMPNDRERAQRLDAVLHVLYLVFNEGYVGSEGEPLVRVDLSTEAIRLARLLARLEPAHAEAAGLLALMLLTDARRRARAGPAGELIPLHEQKRDLWDRAAIDEGTALVAAALARGAVGAYQLQAAIAALHDEAPTMAATDWPQILGLYELLQRITNNPIVALNRAVALAMVNGPAAGLAALAALEEDGRLAEHYRLDAVRAHFLEMAGDTKAAIQHYRAAAARTGSLPERNYLLTKAARLAEGGGEPTSS